MGYGVRLKVSGDYACFSRPEMKVERVSYDVMTPSAARGILEAIYWKPSIRWVIDKITVINPIKFESIRRNELLGKISMNSVKSAFKGNSKVKLYQSTDDIVQRSSLLLKDVCYIIEAHFEMTDKMGETDTVEKHYNIMLRRCIRGQCFHRPYFGTREFPVDFQLLESGEMIESFYKGEERDLGFMLWDIDFKSNETPIFFRPIMKDGVLEVPDLFGGENR
ncbi:CRISPR-associated protein Cas5d [Clostridium collagenovorans DSM 3089]|uniref:pre-crRNA processing endonuclease n=1 Tax=Clostridium collagenovorans DSM 3089 TaxID=1121306 RepID=A0A1M5UTB4_9CLOT|nr:type I-C CRISPR-associated protein Cas5c [Clostridium collagenovorans]SHH66229.1 CRISPR-associated protein Cas5d [Clostridium collagenovorans DSM 3089]